MRKFPRLFLIFYLLLSLTSCAPKPAAPPTAAPTLTSTSTPRILQPSPSPSARPAKTPTQLSLSSLNTPAAVYQALEFELQTDGVYLNPFDPAEINLQVEFTAPDGQTLHAPAFWYQDFDPQTQAPLGPPGFRVRFSPSLPGAWSAQALLPLGGLHSQALEFTVAADDSAPGFVRLHPTNPRYFALDNGATFFPIGINIGWGGEKPLEDYTRWLDRLSANGGNIIRVWMASWSFGIEWNDTPLGDYSNRLYRAWLLDQVFKLAEERGVYIELVLLNHGAFSADVNPEWPNNPYNRLNGGPCARPQDFAADPQSKALFERRLRYIAARWAYSPSLFAWEWWNEANWTPIANDQMAGWIQEMTPVLRESDPYAHLISTSYANGPNPEINNLAEIDFAQLHLYSSADPALEFKDIAAQWTQVIPDKPILFAEFGASAGMENSDSQDKTGLHLHNGLWAATFQGFASPAMYWWWDSYVDPLTLWGAYGRLSAFLSGEDLAALTPQSAQLSSHEVLISALGSDQRLLVWIHDRKNTVYEIEQALQRLFIAGEQAGPDWVYQPEPHAELTLTISSLENGSYTAFWYAPLSGEWLVSQSLQIESAKTELAVPQFSGDIALKIIPAADAGPQVSP